LNFLEKIISQKKVDVEMSKKIQPIDALIAEVRKIVPRNDFKDAIARNSNAPIKVIAEIKRASPSKGIIAEDIDPVEVAQEYQLGGASAISILTEKDFFKGSISDFQKVRRNFPDIPLLRKDFIIDEYQIYQSVQIGADAVLLIVAALDVQMLKKFVKISKDCGISSLVEVHTEEELDKALSAGSEIIGVNNRDLASFKISTETSESLARKIPSDVVSVSESGIRDVADVYEASGAGYDAVLIGEHFMRVADRVTEVKKFTNII
jgi:indole-3-glycerol phosphate synthase